MGILRVGSVCCVGRRWGRKSFQHPVDQRSVARTVANVAEDNNPVAVHHERGGQRDVFPDLFHSIGSNGGQLGVTENRICDTQFLGQSSRGGHGVHGKRDHTRTTVCELRQTFLQLTQLLAAMWSPISAIKDQNGRPLLHQALEGDPLSGNIREQKCGGRISDRESSVWVGHGRSRLRSLLRHRQGRGSGRYGGQ